MEKEASIKFIIDNYSNAVKMFEYIQLYNNEIKNTRNDILDRMYNIDDEGFHTYVNSHIRGAMYNSNRLLRESDLILKIISEIAFDMEHDPDIFYLSTIQHLTGYVSEKIKHLATTIDKMIELKKKCQMMGTISTYTCYRNALGFHASTKKKRCSLKSGISKVRV